MMKNTQITQVFRYKQEKSDIFIGKGVDQENYSGTSII